MSGVPMRMTGGHNAHNGHSGHSGHSHSGHSHGGHNGHSHGGHNGHGPAQGRLSHVNHNVNHAPMMMQTHQYSPAPGVIVTMGGGHMTGHMTPGHHQSSHMTMSSPGSHMSSPGAMTGHHVSHMTSHHHHDNYHHHPAPHHHTTSVPPPPPPSHYQPPPPHPPAPAYTTIPLSQILPPPSAMALMKEKTPMCLVNELARFNKVSHQYRLTDESGPAHKKSFTVALNIGDKEEFSASGPSIKKAQHAAAAIALEKTTFKHPSPKSKNLKNANITPTVELNALAMKRGEATSYTFLEPGSTGQRPGHSGYRGGVTNGSQRTGGGYPPQFCVQLRVGAREFIGEGQTAQSAKHSAAGKALKMLKEMPYYDGGKSKLDPTSQPFTPGIEYDDLKSPISLVHEIALKRSLQVYFEVVREAGPPHMRTFITKCIVGEFITEGEGNGKKTSKKRAAEMMLDRLKQLPPVASAIVLKPRKVVTVKKKTRNLIKAETKEAIPGSGVMGTVSGHVDTCQTINPISRLIQIQQAKKEKEPVYTLVAERGMPRRREFVMQVSVGQHSTTGTGPNKKLAKRAAAEALLQILGYSRPSVQPNKPAIKVPSDSEKMEKGKKLTFVDEVGSQLEGLDIRGHVGSVSGHVADGHVSRQLVPGLLYIDTDKKQGAQKSGAVSVGSGQINGSISQINNGSNSNSQAATIAKELLKGGTSPTADAIAKKSANGSSNGSLPQPFTQLPTSGQGVSPKEQLAYLSQVLGFTVTYNDFPKKGEYLSLVSLSTNPAQVSHGAGSTLEGSHNNAALTALRTLANNGLDSVTDNPASGSTKKVNMK